MSATAYGIHTPRVMFSGMKTSQERCAAVIAVYGDTLTTLTMTADQYARWQKSWQYVRQDAIWFPVVTGDDSVTIKFDPTDSDLGGEWQRVCSSFAAWIHHGEPSKPTEADQEALAVEALARIAAAAAV